MSLTGGSKFILTGGANYQIARSLRFRASNGANLTRTNAGTITNNKIFTVSFWDKWSLLQNVAASIIIGGASANNRDTAGYGAAVSTAGYQYEIRDTIAGTYDLLSSAVYRDPSAHAHTVISVDTTQAINTNRIKIYRNGVAVVLTGSYPAQNYVFDWNLASAAVVLGQRYAGSAQQYFDGLLSEMFFIDGQALDQTYFGQTNATTGAWNPIKYTGTYGTNGFYLPFSDNSAATSTTIGKDSSGNGNNWTPSGISITAGVTNDSLVDTPTNYGTDTGAGGEVRGNYCTLNPLDKNSGAGAVDGNLTSTASGSWQNIKGSIGVMSGKWFWEVKITAAAQPRIGVATSKASMATFGGSDANQWCYYYDGATYGMITNANGGANSYGTTFTTGDLITVFLDADNGKLYFAKGATLLSSGDLTAGTGFAVDGSSNPLTGLSGAGPYFPYFSHYTTGYSYTANFGQRNFDSSTASLRAIASALGFKALCTQNLPAPAIAKPSLFMDVNTRAGTGAAFSVTGKSFQPDLVWMKGRSGATDHAIYDAVRTATKDLGSNLATDETTQVQGLTAFNSDGFSGGTLAKINTSAATYVDWMWKKGATPGIDVVSYTGNGANRTIAHALGVVPSMMLVKSRVTAGADTGWAVYHSALANTEYLKLESTSAKSTGATYWNSTTPTSSVFSLGTAADTNTNSDTYINYLFAEVAGFSKFGSYTGNGSADGPFVFTNMLPRYILIKRTDSTSDWYIWDTARDTYNVESATLLADTSGAETSAASIDGLSNGFKCRSSTVVNASGGTYIYAAFASSPFKYSRAR